MKYKIKVYDAFSDPSYACQYKSNGVWVWGVIEPGYDDSPPTVIDGKGNAIHAIREFRAAWWHVRAVLVRVK